MQHAHHANLFRLSQSDRCSAVYL